MGAGAASTQAGDERFPKAGKRPTPPRSIHVTTRKPIIDPADSSAPRTSKDAEFSQAVEEAVERGASWLGRSQKPDGTFTYGWIPSLNRPIEDDNLLRQAGAAAALARAGRFARDDRQTGAAERAIHTLIASYTKLDSKDRTQRRPSVDSNRGHPLGFAALVLWAISELPSPAPELSDAGEQLARYMVGKQRDNGVFSLSYHDDDEAPADDEGVNFYPGEALYALMRSHLQRPADFKLNAVRKAYSPYRRLFKQRPAPAFVPWQSAAFAEAFLLTGEARYADFVFEMNDWLLRLQYVDPEHNDPSWLGGFGNYQYGHVLRTPPGAATGSCVESLVEACRAAKHAGDENRVERYRRAIELAIAFLMKCQYREGAQLHFEPEYSRKLGGAFYAGVEDGSIRIDFAQHAISGMVHYLTYVADERMPDQKPERTARAPKARSAESLR